MGGVSVPEVLYGSAIAVLVIYVLMVVIRQTKNLPPGPFPLPFLGNLHVMGTYPHQSLAKLAEKYGPLMSIYFGQNHVIVATSPETAMEFLKNQDANFCSRPKRRSAQIIFPNDVTFSDVSPHSKNLRKIIQQQLTTSKRMEAAQKIRVDEVAQTLRCILQDGSLVNVRFHTEVLSANIFSQIVFSKRLLQPASITSKGHKNGDNVEELTELMEVTGKIDFVLGSPDVGDLVPALKPFDVQGLKPRFQNFRTRMETFIANIVKERLEQRKRNAGAVSSQDKDYLDQLLDQVDENVIDLEIVTTMIWEVFGAGMNTTNATTEWALAEVIGNPDVMKKVHAELDEVVGKDRMLQESDLPKLKYMKAVVKEGLRLHPPIPVLAHQCIKSCKAFGYNIPAGTGIFINLWALGRLEKNYSNPHKFIPQRFMEGGPNASIDYQGQSFDLLPFSSGRRICAGLPLATVLLQISIANLLHAFTWTPPKGFNLAEGAGQDSVPKRDALFAYAQPRLPLHLY